MPKNTKSSASSATRKKKAQKAAKKGGDQDGNVNGTKTPSSQPSQRGQKKVKGKGKEPKKKVYIPPTKPKQDVIDPLDSLGLAGMLPSDLVVLLRKAGKKDVVTRCRALEGLIEWIQGQGEEEEDRKSALILALPCWAHLFPRLSISPNRRLRQLTSRTNALLLSSKAVFPELLSQPELLEAIIGGMLILAFDPDRQVARISKATWDQHTTWSSSTDQIYLQDYVELFLSHISTIIFHQNDESAPPSSVIPLGTTRDAKNRDDVNVEEDVEGTDARLVYGALGALSWLLASQPYPASTDRFEPLMTSSTLWTSLSRHPVAQQRILGSLSPIVRTAAWQLISTLVVNWKELLDKCLPAFGFLALQSAFQENDVGVASNLREGLVTLLRSKPEVWKMRHDDADEEEDDDEEEEGDDENEDENENGTEGDSDEGKEDQQEETSNHKELAVVNDFPLYKMLLEWVSSGLRGTSGNYSIVIVLLSTTPTEVFPPSSSVTTAFLNAMYTPIDEQSIEGREALRAFLPAFLECFIWSSARVNKSASTEEAVVVVKDIGIFYSDFVGSSNSSSETSKQQERTASIGEDRIRVEVATLLRKLGNVEVALALPLLDLIRKTLSQTIFEPSHALMDRNIAVLKAATTSTSTANVSPLLCQAIHELVSDLSITTANIVASGEAQSEGIRLLRCLLTELPIAHGNETIPSLKLIFDLLLQTQNVELSEKDYALFFAAYIASIEEEGARWQAWTSVLNSLCQDGKLKWARLEALMPAMLSNEPLVKGAPSSNLDAAIQDHYEEGTSIVRRLMMKPRPYIHPEAVDALLDKVSADVDLKSLPLLDAWLQADSGNLALFLQQGRWKNLTPKLVHLALLGNEASATNVWKSIKDDERAVDIALEVLSNQLRKLEEPLNDVLDAMASLSSSRRLMEIVPNESTMLQFFSSACAVQVPPSLAVLDSLASTSLGQDKPGDYDEAGLTAYCRCSIALLEALEQTGVKATWTLPHLVFLALAGEDASLVHDGGGSSHFSKTAEPKSYIVRAIRVATSILSSVATNVDETWFDGFTKSIKSSSTELTTKDDLQSMFVNLWRVSNSARVFARLLKGLLNFSGAGEKEGVQCLRLAQSTQDSSPLMACAIYSAVKELIMDSPVYDRIRNELAARLAGVSPSKADSEGIRVLRLLIEVAPPVDSSLSLIPQQRSIFLLQTLQKWIASDESEDFSKEMHTLLIQLMSHLVPIVQDMPGSHLPFICDLMDINLSEGMDNFVCVYHTLNLVELFHGLAERNSTLREVWKESKLDIFENVHQLFLTRPVFSQDDKAGQAMEEALVDVVRIAPESLFTSELDVGPLMKIIRSGKTQSQILAFRLLSNSIRERVKEMVVEAAVGGRGEGDGEEMEPTPFPLTKVKIEDEIISFLSSSDVTESSDYGFLLTWMAIFEYFEEASLQFKSIYTSQIQSLGLVENSLLPFFFNQTELYFDPSRWALDEVYLDEVEPSEGALRVLTTHIFYRSLIHIPNLIRESFNGLKDRQQSLYLRNFIVKNLTPLLSLREFGHLRDQETITRITDENMSIKVLAGSNEVIATYTVDEYPLEISIGMPNDYPLRNVEIKDLKKIGVSEGTWRAWILSIRQLIAGRNGLIFDGECRRKKKKKEDQARKMTRDTPSLSLFTALMLFKRNVEAKFSGFDEDSTCAVCYSIVSPTDHSLPTKPCKTCKKKFHASCLYKWVSTSGSSTCPLCRSIL